MKKRSRTGAAALVLGASGLAIAAGYSHHKTRPNLRPGIPAHYEYAPLLQRTGIRPAIAIAGLVRQPPVAADGTIDARMAFYHLGELPLQADHCVVHSLDLTLFNSGLWQLDLGAVQNVPTPPPPGLHVTPGTVLHTQQIVSNRFDVVVKLYALAPAAALGNPAQRHLVATIAPTPFLVRNGQLRRITFHPTREPRDQAAVGRIRQHFIQIDHVEVELTYH